METPMNPKSSPSALASAALPRSFRVIRLELARESGHPDGSRLHGYTLVAPLDDEDRIDAEIWKNHPRACRVVRFRPDEENDIGHLVHKGSGWGFHYDLQGEDPDEVGFRFATERFVLGEYVSIREQNGLRTFQVTSVEHL
jgi:hypothetical protein